MFGIAELLVAKGVVNNLVITRMPIGHTHEDIAVLRGKHIVTMYEYKN